MEVILWSILLALGLYAAPWVCIGAVYVLTVVVHKFKG